jgi:glycine cleavage system H lipoate-binding protein
MVATINIERYRGDTIPDQFTIKDSAGVAVNITGYSFLLTVNSEKSPTDTTNQLYELTGIITDALNGKVEFAPSAVQADQTPAGYFFNVQMTDAASAITTIVVGKYKYIQDITKT